VFVIDLPVLIINDINNDQISLNTIDALGWAIWIIGFVIEVLADA